MNSPRFVKPGQPVRASDINDIVSAVRSTRRTSFPDSGNVARRFRPFDVMDIYKDGATWLLRLQPGFLIDGATATAVKAKDAATEEAVPLTDHPDIEVESTTAEPKNLYFSFSERALVWRTAEEAGTGSDLLIILTVTESEDASGLTFTNHHPAPIYAKPVVPFTVSVVKDGETYKATVAPGYFRVKNPADTGGNPVTDWMPELGGTPLDQTTGDPAQPPSLTVSDGDVIYLHFFTDMHGIVSDVPTVQASTGEQSIHYQPDEDNGVEGEYWLRIAQVAIADGVASVRQFQEGGPIEFVPNLWNYKQVGGGRKIIRERDNENDVYEFRTLKEKASDPQVKIVQEEEYLEIKGNGYANAITDARKVSMSVSDGLVTSLSYTDTETGMNCTVTIRDCDGNPMAEPPILGTALLTMEFSEGKLISVNGDNESSAFTATVQSCCWIDDPAEDDWRS